MPKTNAFFIPLEINHLVVTKLADNSTFAGQLADFSLMPHREPGEDCALPRLRPNVSEDLVSKPFEPTNDPLMEGIHLQWTVPKEFRRAHIFDQSNTPGGSAPKYRAMPNRWYIKREVFDEEGNPLKVSGEKVKSRSWVLESDRLSTTKERGSAAFPLPPEKHQGKGPAYRYLGKVFTYEEWLQQSDEEKNNAQYLGQLTAFGYGDPLFAAYYPESRNVFGFHDDLVYYLEGDNRTQSSSNKKGNDEPPTFNEMVKAERDKIRFKYSIYGWYSSPWNDPLQTAEFKLWRDIFRDSSPESERPLNYPENLRPFEENTGDRDDPFGLIPYIRHPEAYDRTEEFNWLVQIFPYGKKNFTRTDQKKQVRDWDYNELRKALVENKDVPLLDIPEAARQDICGRSVLAGRIENIKLEASDSGQEKIKIALANSPGQALAALLADGSKEAHQMERMLDALQLGLFAEQDQLDFPARLDSALHEAAFSARKGEVRWRISAEFTDSAGKHTSLPIPEVPENQALLLQKLNKHQTKADQLGFELNDLRERLYADWYKYLITEYDFDQEEITLEAHVNEIRAFLADQVTAVEKQEEEQQNALRKAREAQRKLAVEIAYWNEQHSHKHIAFKLQKIPGPRYWAPNEPVLLFQGEGIKPDARYLPNDERLSAFWVNDFFIMEEVAEADTDQAILQKILAEDEDEGRVTAEYLLEEKIKPQDGSTPGWNPIMMDWEVQLFPLTKIGDQDFNQRDWPYDAIVANYDLPYGSPELRVQPLPEQNTAAKDIYGKWADKATAEVDIQQYDGKRLQSFRGRTFLTASAHLPFVEQLKELLKVNDNDQANELIAKLNDMGVLSQSLAGFNSLLLMRKQILQLQVGDPLAELEILKEFAARLRQAIGRQNTSAPLPSNLFFPIREGAFQIRKIRFIDCWGRAKDFNLSENNSAAKIIIADSLRPPEPVSPPRENMAYLPPRLVQPCRLNFRWLPAEQTASEAGTTPNDDPICGYFMPNFLDKTLDVYDARGKGLWTLGRSADALRLKPFPGTHELPSLDDVAINRHLRRFVRATLQNDLAFLEDFLASARASLNANLAESYAQFDGMAFLVGRPLALVRAKMNLELKGLPAQNHSWSARETEYFGREHHISESMGFDKLRFAVRMGEKNLASDGLFAFYIDKPEQEVQEIYSPYRKGKPTPQENYWRKLAILEKWRDVYTDRLLVRQEEYGRLDLTYSAINSELLRLLNVKKNLESRIDSVTADLDSEEEEVKEKAKLEWEALKEDLDMGVTVEINRLQKLSDSRSGRLEALRIEEENLLLLLQEKEDEIKEHKAKHGLLETGPGIYSPHSDLLTVSLAEDEVQLGILMDPRCAVHLTTGILPVKKVDIPSSLFADAINNIQMAFLTNPVISPMPFTREEEIQRFLLQSPRQAGYQWSWLQPESDGSWQEYGPDEIETPPSGQFPIFSPQAIFEGWMLLKEEKKQQQSPEA